VKLPMDQTTTAAAGDPLPLKLDSQVQSATVATQNIPLTPPAPKDVSPSAAAASSIPPPRPDVPVVKKKGFFTRLRNYVFTLLLLGVISFAGGVWYSRINDNFHDFFTEYVPYGEQAVLYLEEQDLRRRFPRGTGSAPARRGDSGAQVKIAPQSGASWRVADGGEASRKNSAVREISAAKGAAQATDAAKMDSSTETKTKPEALSKETKPIVKAGEPSKAAAVPAAAAAAADAVKDAASATKDAVASPKTSATSAKADFKIPEVDEPSRFPPASPIDPLKVKDADEPVVQDLIKMLNDIITVVNADNADDRFSSSIGKAKNELNKIGSKIRDIKSKVEEDAAKEVATKVTDFEKAAGELINRVENAMASQERTWRSEFETEMKRVKEQYDARFATESERQQHLNEEKLKNMLLEQAVELRRHFVQEVKDSVETERNGRLGKLDKLSSAVSELEKLTTGWNDVVDVNIQTQQLHVAVEAVRASLDDSEHPRPFVRELVALREIASEDSVINAAIASINPSAYQRGIATPSQLIDRFRRVASEVRKASLLPDDAGVASHASSWVLSKVMFKKQGLAEGNDVESILTRTQTYLEEGDLDNAAREMNGLHGWAKTLSRDWLGEVRKVLEVQQALDVSFTILPLMFLPVTYKEDLLTCTARSSPPRRDCRA
jgi:MICOS complex subunit MIC60